MSAVVIEGGEAPAEEAAVPRARVGEAQRAARPDPRATGGPSDAGSEDLVLRTVGGYVTLTDAADFFGLNYWRLRKAVTRGELPARKSGPGQTSPYFVRVRDVTSYLANGFRRRQGRRRKSIAAD